MNFRIGYGYDLHRLVKGRKCIIGGVDIPFEKGLQGHSDADVLLHAITDALLGALALGDIGTHFPDTDPIWKGSDSKTLLSKSYQKITDRGFVLQNLDSTLVAEKPNFNPYIKQICESIASTLDVAIDQVSVKATTNEKMGYLGKGEGVVAHTVVLIKSEK